MLGLAGGLPACCCLDNAAGRGCCVAAACLPLRLVHRAAPRAAAAAHACWRCHASHAAMHAGRPASHDARRPDGQQAPPTGNLVITRRPGRHARLAQQLLRPPRLVPLHVRRDPGDWMSCYLGSDIDDGHVRRQPAQPHAAVRCVVVALRRGLGFHVRWCCACDRRGSGRSATARGTGVGPRGALPAVGAVGE
jgi:hypothetical protein